MSSKEFKDWLDDEISKESDCEWYDRDGSSSRAVVCRMKKGYAVAIKWEAREVLRDAKYFFTDEFDGFNTTIGWFIQALLMPILIPIVPFTRTANRHNKAIAEYVELYNRRQYK